MLSDQHRNPRPTVPVVASGFVAVNFNAPKLKTVRYKRSRITNVTTIVSTTAAWVRYGRSDPRTTCSALLRLGFCGCITQEQNDIYIRLSYYRLSYYASQKQREPRSWHGREKKKNIVRCSWVFNLRIHVVKKLFRATKKTPWQCVAAPSSRRSINSEFHGSSHGPPPHRS